MARIHGALEILDKETKKGTGLYHYGVYSDEEHWVHAQGPCADGCPGHKTKKEACDHYYRWVAENKTKIYEDTETMKKCAVCGVFTTMRGAIDDDFYDEYILCKDHATKEQIAEIFLREHNVSQNPSPEQSRPDSHKSP